MGVWPRIAASARYRLSARSLYVDLHTHADETIVLCGSRRSGTTWLSEIVNYRNDFRTIFEPFHPMHSSWGQDTHPEWAKYVEPDFSDTRLIRRCNQLWSGRLRDAWSDKHNTKRVASRRIIKSVATTNLLPWIRVRWPNLKIVYVLRHPFATSESQLDLDFQDDGLTDLTFLRVRARLTEGVYETLRHDADARELVNHAAEPFEQHVVRWCLENAIPLARLRQLDAHVVFYEDLVMEIKRELDRLATYLGYSFDQRALAAAARPSRTDFRHRAELRTHELSPEAFLATWQERVGARQVESGLRVLRAFELDHLYGAGPLPLVGADDVLAGGPSRIGRPIPADPNSGQPCVESSSCP